MTLPQFCAKEVIVNRTTHRKMGKRIEYASKLFLHRVFWDINSDLPLSKCNVKGFPSSIDLGQIDQIGLI